MGTFTQSNGQDGLDPCPPDAVTFVILPDSQHYIGPGTKITEQGLPYLAEAQASPYIQDHLRIGAGTTRQPNRVTNSYLNRHIEWILQNLQRQRIRFVSHVGDVVERNRDAEWAVAKPALDRLRGRVPFGISPGNHDMEIDGDASRFQAAFPAASFADRSWYVESFDHERTDRSRSHDNVNSAQVIDADGVNVLWLHLECNAPDDVLQWAAAVTDRYPDHTVFATTHMDLGPIEKPSTRRGFVDNPKGRMRWTKRHGEAGNSGQQLWDKFFRKIDNLRLVFSGDQSRTVTLRVSETNDAGHEVHSLLSDYKSLGALRLVRFFPVGHRVDVITYDTTLRQRVTETPYVDGTEPHQFSLQLDPPNPGGPQP